MLTFLQNTIVHHSLSHKYRKIPRKNNQ